MVGQAFILFLVAAEHLFLVTFQSAVDTLISALQFERTLHHEEVLVMPDVLAFDGVEIALAEGQVMDGVEQVGLSLPIITGKDVHAMVKLQAGLAVILKIYKGNLLQEHEAKLRSFGFRTLCFQLPTSSLQLPTSNFHPLAHSTKKLIFAAS